ncbi:TonB-dependent receptor domain-containing protein [Celerinatantimonas diazotrophica]|uniref:Vitamin B12 transporter n=1 Tax=Celerinatantimonas diazotrophica TaxID=412034 RepID=A0A4R1K6D6_9GAMM|nr:TonB-dependent receptor [Celerinatantimonas diazotrophica]TCK59785.1 vitamin B12 transporter [Celerinatantimonas diazotrophica]CAG9295532.1 Vitamin B12 transporter BtuB [Celerinatantimonas diazotrophica]
MKSFWVLGALIPFVSHAQASMQGNDMIVTANRMPQSINNVLAPFTVISAKQIEQMQVKSIADVLAMQPGVQIRRSGGRGTATSLSIRGSNSNQTLVLIDGVRAMNASAGSGSFNFLPTSMVERIEIIRGPRAARYGADAMAGVVNIITKPSAKEKVNRLRLGLGAHNYWQSGWRFVHPIGDDTQFQANLDAEGSDGYNFKPDSTPAHNYGYSTQQALFTLQHRFNDNWSADGEMILNRGHGQYNGYGMTTEANNTLIQQYFSSSLFYDSDAYSSHWNLNYGVDDSRDYSSSYSRFVTQRYAGSWLNSWQLNDNWQIDAGIDARQSDLGRSSIEYSQTKRYNIGGYSSVSYMQGPYHVDASLRQDHNERYGNNTTYSVAGGWSYLSNQQVTLSYGTAFHAPSFNDLYWPLSYGYQGNPNLKPEKSQNLELGFKGQIQNIHYQWNLYHTNYRDLIETTSDYSTSENISKARIMGSELILKFATGPIQQQLSYTYLDSENKQTNKVLIYRPWNSGKWQADWLVLPKLNLHTGINWSGHRFSSSTERLPSYWTMNIAAGYQFTSAFKLSASVHNLFDRDYQQVASYLAPGIQTNLTAQYDF